MLERHLIGDILDGMIYFDVIFKHQYLSTVRLAQNFTIGLSMNAQLDTFRR